MMISKCLKIVFANDEDLNAAIEISHPPEAIEVISRPVYDKYSPKKIGYIKLHRCKLCGMVMIP